MMTRDFEFQIEAWCEKEFSLKITITIKRKILENQNYRENSRCTVVVPLGRGLLAQISKGSFNKKKIA